MTEPDDATIIEMSTLDRAGRDRVIESLLKFMRGTANPEELLGIMQGIARSEDMVLRDTAQSVELKLMFATKFNEFDRDDWNDLVRIIALLKSDLIKFAKRVQQPTLIGESLQPAIGLLLVLAAWFGIKYVGVAWTLAAWPISGLIGWTFVLARRKWRSKQRLRNIMDTSQVSTPSPDFDPFESEEQWHRHEPLLDDLQIPQYRNVQFKPDTEIPKTTGIFSKAMRRWVWGIAAIAGPITWLVIFCEDRLMPKTTFHLIEHDDPYVTAYAKNDSDSF